jgi:PucR family transcriptional regulator, purine catabolism regulatory protein
VQKGRPVLTLGDLLEERALGLALRTGSAEAAGRPVLGAAVVEVESPARWIAPEWVLLTAGVRLGGDSGDELRSLVVECDDAGVAALGFGIGPVFDELPAALLEEGRARGYPIFAVPFETPFRDVVRFVDTAIMGADAPLFRRLSSLQRFVVDALRDPEPERAVVERLGRFLDASVAVLSAGGVPELSRGRAPVEALWRAVAGQGPAVLEAEADGWHAVVAPLAGRAGEPPRWLLLASPRSGFIGTLAKRAAEMTAPLLVAMERLKAVAHEQELAVRGALLDEALGPGAASDLASLAARAAAFELDFTEPARLVLVRGRGPDAAVVRHELGEALARAGAAHLLSEREGAVVALVPLPREALEAVVAEHAGTLAGIGRPVAGIGDARVSLRDAELALERAASAGGAGLVAFEQFDLGTLLLSEAAPERLEPKIEAIVSVLREHPALHEALVAYFDHDLDVGATAAQLHLHPNSLRYRLTRIEQLLGCSLRRPATIAELHIALLGDTRTRRTRF